METDKDTLKKLYIALKKTQARLKALEDAQTEPIAVIGMACRFPGGANDPETYWRLIENGQDLVSPVPPERWDADAFYDPDPETPGKMITKMGGFLNFAPDEFDAPFFSISPKEATSMDPQQRLLLEVTWEALENAGINPSKLSGSKTGVFIGICSDDYTEAARHSADLRKIDPYVLTGTTFSVANGRISYVFGFQGPSMAIDTACSSSLVAFHLACRSLRANESSMAVVGGVNLMLVPGTHICCSKLQAISPDGRCKTFDAAANGYVRGEGCGIVILKRLSDAVQDGDRILALARASAVNQDGRRNGLTAPNGISQQDVMRQALDAADVLPEKVGYVEAHGTGTALGDPIEVESVSRVFCKDRSFDNPLVIGSVKTNIGHLESTAGIAGLMKIVLSFSKDIIPPHLHFKHPSPHIPWDELPLKVPVTAMPWPASEAPRIACINAFGFSGTNAHVVLEAPPENQDASAHADTQPERPFHVLSLSAKTPAALESLREKYLDYLSENDSANPADICFTANSGRSAFDYRLAVTGATVADLKESLSGLRIKEMPPSSAPADLRIVFMFTGQGSQFLRMGQTLYETQPVFKKALDRCDGIVGRNLDVSLKQLLYGTDARPDELAQTIHTQPAVFSIEYALYQLWLSWGIKPSVVMGHSVGEYVAACAAGVFSLEDGLKLICERARLIQSLPEAGAMAAVFTDPSTVEALVFPYSGQISIAAVNTPNQVVVSGDRETMRVLTEKLKKQDIRCVDLNVSHAFHSPLMEPMLGDFQRAASEIEYSAPRIPLISNITGKKAGDEVTTPDYWVRHVRMPVRFADAVSGLLKNEYRVFLEVGPRPVLLAMAGECLEHDSEKQKETAHLLPSLRPGTGDWQQMLESLKTLYMLGAAVDWEGFDRGYRRSRVVLPNYPWQKQRYRISTSFGSHFGQIIRENKSNQHPLLGQRFRSVALNENQFVFESEIGPDSPGFLTDHRVFGNVVMPGAAYFDIAFAAGRAVFKTDRLVLDQVTIIQPLIFDSDRQQILQTLLEKTDDESCRFRICSPESENEDASWIVHATGAVSASQVITETTEQTRAIAEPQDSRTILTDPFYQYLESKGTVYGPCFRGVHHLSLSGNNIFCTIQLPDAVKALPDDDPDVFLLHPALLDSCFQAVAADLFQRENDPLTGEKTENAYLPVGADQIHLIRRPGRQVRTQLIVHPPGADPNTLSADLLIFDKYGGLSAKIERLSFRKANPKLLMSMLRKEHPSSVYQIDWRPEALKSGDKAGQANKNEWLILADRQGTAEQAASGLRAIGDACTLVWMGEEFKEENQGVIVNPLDASHFDRLFRNRQEQQLAPYNRIIDFWNLEPPPDQRDAGADSVDPSILSKPFIDCVAVLNLIRAVSRCEQMHSPRMYLVTRGSQPAGPVSLPLNVDQAPVWGLAQAISAEHPDLKCTRIDMDFNEYEREVDDLIEELVSDSEEEQSAWRSGIRYVSRLSRFRLPDSTPVLHEPFQVKSKKPGTLENMSMEPMKRQSPTGSNIEIQVHATGLNFKDILHALGMIRYQQPFLPDAESNHSSAAEETFFGIECSGTVTTVGSDVRGIKVGDPVIAVMAEKSLSSHVLAQAHFVVKKPSTIDHEQAATIPLVFLTAWYGLSYLGKIKAGDRVLIHAAAGGVGQAAIQIAQHAGAEVFATAGEAKHGILKAMGIKHVMNSRTLDFAEKIMSITGGQGVDIVLNSLNREFIPKSLNITARGGRFIEIGKIGVWNPDRVRSQRPDISYFNFDLSEVAAQDASLICEMLKIVFDLVEKGTFKPLPMKVFAMSDVKKAFHYMSTSQHIGKVVVSQPDTKPMLRKEGSYLITGGLGNLGIRLAKRLSDQGAGCLILMGRSSPSDEATEAIKKMEKNGTQVIVAAADVADKEDVDRVLENAKNTAPPLRGIIHAAGVLKDGILLQLDPERFKQVMAPKIAGAWNLHHATTKLNLDFFVCFSSAATVMGAPGQGNYSAANAFLDALAFHRKASGQPATSINWGPWAETGMAAELKSRDQKRLANQGIEFISPQAGLDIMESIIKQRHLPQAMVLPIHWEKFLSRSPVQKKIPFFEAFYSSQTQVSALKRSRFSQQLKTVPMNRRRPVLMNHIRTRVAEVIGLNMPEKIEPRQRLFDLGIDSLMAVNLKNMIESDMEKALRPTLIFDFPTVESLTNHLCDLLGLSDQTDKPDHKKNEAQDENALAEISDSEAEDLLLKEIEKLGI